MAEKADKFRPPRIWIWVALCLPLNDALSADWSWIFKNSHTESTYYVDMDTINQDGAFFKAWVLENRSRSKSKYLTPAFEGVPALQKQPKLNRPYKSYVAMYILDCERKNAAIARGLYFTDFKGAGDLISSFEKEINSTSLKPIKNDSVDEAILNFVCSRAKEKSRLQT